MAADNNDATAAGLKIDELNVVPSDFLKDLLNDINASTSTALASAGLSVGDWGTHNNTIDFGAGSSLTIKQVLLWGGLGLLGWFLVRKIRGK